MLEWYSSCPQRCLGTASKSSLSLHSYRLQSSILWCVWLMDSSARLGIAQRGKLTYQAKCESTPSS
eukprot:2439463-Amphidinium_carterae.1